MFYAFHTMNERRVIAMKTKNQKKLTKEEIYKRVREILSKDKQFQVIKLKIDFVNKK